MKQIEIVEITNAKDIRKYLKGRSVRVQTGDMIFTLRPKDVVNTLGLRLFRNGVTSVLVGLLYFPGGVYIESMQDVKIARPVSVVQDQNWRSEP